MDQVIGGTSATARQQSDADIAAAKRRADIQAYFHAYQSDPLQIMGAMAIFGVSVAELDDAMAYQMNVGGIVRYLRKAGAPDGFGGLKVWPAATIRKLLDYVAAQGTSNAIGLRGITDPVDAQDVLDNVARLKTIGYVPPWEV